MDLSDPTPRVNFELLQTYVGKRVRLVAAIEGVDGATVNATAADGGKVQVQLAGPLTTDNKFVEFEGQVLSPDTLQATDHTGFGNNFDMKNYNELCKLANGPYKAIFL